MIKESTNGNGKHGLGMTHNEMELVSNVMLSRQMLIDKYLDPRRDVDLECGHPKTAEIVAETYKELYDRGLGRRVVEILPLESWKSQPEVYEDEDAENVTAFEQAWDDLGKGLLGDSGESLYQDEKGSPVWEYLCRADILSGIGHFGVLLLGLDDGLELWQPAAGITETGLPEEQMDFGQGTEAQYHRPLQNYKLTVNAELTSGRKLLFLRTFDESLVQVTQYEANRTSPRFGQPKMYQITLNDPNENHTGIGLTTETLNVHWSRIIHLADNRGSSEIFGAPRMRACLNNLLDLRKLYGGSAEMYWRGAFPGLSIETQPQLGAEVEIDKAGVRAQMTSYMNGLQRFLALQGMTAKSLAPQVVDPTAQVDVHITSICILMGTPKRLFMGSERGELASGQDSTTWNERLTYRRTNYLTPKVIVPFVNRLIMVGVLPRPVGFSVSWPDLESLTELEKTTVAQSKVTSLSTYVSSGLDVLMPPMEFLTRIMSYSEEEAKAILEAAAEAQAQAAVQPQLDENGDPIPPEEQVDEQGNPIPPEGEIGPDSKPVDADPNKAGIQAMAGRRREKLDAMKEGMQNRDKDKGKEPSMNTLSDEVLTLLLQNSGNCGTGAGGFQPGNSCAASAPSADSVGSGLGSGGWPLTKKQRVKQRILDTLDRIDGMVYKRVQRQDAEDIIQSARLKIIKAAAKWEDMDTKGRSWNAYATATIKNTIKDYYEKVGHSPKQRQQTSESGSSFPERASRITPPSSKALKGAERRNIRMAISLLNTKEQHVIKEVVMDGRPIGDVAAELGTSYTQISRIKEAALSKVKRTLEGLRGGFDPEDVLSILENAAKKQANPNACGDGPGGFQGGNTCAKGGGAGGGGASSEQGSSQSDAPTSAAHKAGEVGKFAAGAAVGAVASAGGGVAGAHVGGGIGGAIGGALTAPIGGVGAVPGAAVGAVIGGLIGSLLAGSAASHVAGQVGGESAQLGAAIGSVAGDIAGVGGLVKGAKAIGGAAKSIGGAAGKAVAAKADKFVAGKVAKEVGKNAMGIADAAKKVERSIRKPLVSSSPAAERPAGYKHRLTKEEYAADQAKIKAKMASQTGAAASAPSRPAGFKNRMTKEEYAADQARISSKMARQTSNAIVTPEERLESTSKALQSQSPILHPQHQQASDHYVKAKEKGGLNVQEEAALEALPDMLEGINSVLKTAGPSGLSGDAADTYMNVSTAIVKAGRLPKPLVVFRATSCPAPSDEIEPGMIVQVQGFQVGTLNQSIAESMSSGVVLKINAKTGIYLAGTSDRARRGLEFLQAHGTRYKVLGVKENGKLNYILLEELV